MASEVVCKFVLIDVPSDFFNKVFGPANIVVVKSALQSDTWGPVASLCEFTDVAIDDLRGVADRITFEARIKLDSEAKKDATVRSLRNYVNDRFKCFRGASSVIRAEVPSAHPSALLRECFIDGAPVEEPPKPQEVRRAPTPPPAPVREHLTSPSREQHVNTHVRDSHIVALNDVHMYERERRPRPPGGFKVDDLILGYLPPMNKSASTSAQTSRERDAYLGVELSRRHGYGPSQRVHHDDQRYDYIDVTADDGADYREDRWSVRPSPSSHRGHFSPAPTHPAAAGHRASSTRRVVVMDEPDASRRGRQGTPGRHAYPADAVADDGAYRQPRRSEFERDVRRAPDEFLRGSSRPKTREVVDADDNLRARSSSRSSRHGVGYESVGRRYTTRGGQDMPRRF